MPDALQGRRLLVVEDEYLLAVAMTDLLEEHGAEVIGPAASVADALALIETRPDIDGAILDINLRGDRVFPVADALAARRVPFLFASGYDESVIPARFAGAELIVKPVDAATMLETVTRTL